MGQDEILAVTQSGKGAELMVAHRHLRIAVSDHVRPDLVDVGGMGKVDHVGGKAAAGAHVDLQRHNLTFFAQTLVVGQQTEELKVNETALYAKALNGGTTGGTGVLRQIFQDVVDGVVVVVYNVHDRVGGHVAGLEQRLAVFVDDGIVAVYLGVDELFHDIGYVFRTARHKVGQILVGFELVGRRGANAVVRLDHHRIADLFDKGAAAGPVIHQMVAGNGNAHLLIVFLHLGFVLDAGQVVYLKTAVDVKVGAQMRILLQPVFVVGFQPVDPSVFKGKESNGTVYLVVVFHRADLVVFGQTLLQFRHQLVVGLITDAQHVHAVVSHFSAELPVVGGKVGGNKDHIFHVFQLFSLKFRSKMSEYKAFYSSLGRK